ncbi:MAG: hypothetical protein K2W96_07670 [Gemmataceae bacterium]|nr:hypothetical protein [Gemmataceae bacterium]
MPGALLREAAGLRRELAAIDEARRLVLARAEEVVRDLVGEARRLVAEWQRLCVAVAKGEAARVQGMRESLVQEAAGCLAAFDATEGIGNGAGIGEARGRLRRLVESFSR